MKARITKAYDAIDNSVFYQLQFKLDGEARYKGYSHDLFKTEEDAKKALKLHESGERVYKYERSVERRTRKNRGRKVILEKKLAFHILRADTEIEESVIWAKS